MGLASKLAKEATKKVVKEKKKKLKIKKERTEGQKKQDKAFGTKKKLAVEDQAREYYRKKYPDKKERMALFGDEFEGPSWEEMGVNTKLKKKK